MLKVQTDINRLCSLRNEITENLGLKSLKKAEDAFLVTMLPLIMKPRGEEVKRRFFLVLFLPLSAAWLTD